MNSLHVCVASLVTQGMRRLVAEVVRPASKSAEALRDSAAGVWIFVRWI